jgi:hypothetical protein
MEKTMTTKVNALWEVQSGLDAAVGALEESMV